MSAVTTTLIYGGVDLAAIGGVGTQGYVVRRNIDRRPAKRLTKILIPGRDGVQYVDEGTYDNVPASYSITWSEDFARCASLLCNYLLSRKGYNDLLDGYDTETYRHAQIAGAIDPVPTENRDKGYVILTFDCLPRRYFRDEPELVYTDTDPHEMFNLTYFDSLPLITVTGNGTLSGYLGGVTPPYKWSFTVSGRGASDKTIIDSDREDCYSPTGVSRNSNVAIVNRFPRLYAGESTFVVASGFSEVRIQRRYWMQ